jgi:hypothetical protein
MKFVKRLIILFLILLFLSLGTVFVLITFYKKEMATMLTQHLKESYGLTLKAEDVNVSFLSNWPNASVQFENIYLSNDLYNEEPLLKASSVSLSFNLRKLLKKEFIINSIAIKDAKINLIRNKEGFKNFEFKKRDTSSTTKSNIRFEVGTISIKSTEFSFLNKQYNKKIELTLIDDVIGLVHYADGVDVKLVGNVFVKGLLFRPEKGPFLSNTLATLNLEARICASRREFFIHQPSFVTIKNQKINVAAFITLSEDKKIVLSIDTKHINFEDGISLLNQGVKKGLSTINIDKPLDVKALIIAKIGEQEEPIIIANIRGSHNNVTLGNSKIPYTDVDLNASIISLDTSLLKGNADHAKVILRRIKGKVYGFPFNGSVIISNFTKPYIEISANLYIDAKKIPFKLGKEFILAGDANATLHYFGPVSKLNKNEFLDAPMTLVAKVKFNKVSYRENGNPYTYLVNGNAMLTNKELSFDNLALKMNGGDIKLKGSVDNFVQFGLGYTTNFKAKLIAATDYFDLTSYVVKSTGAKNDSSNTKEQTKKIKAADDESNFEFDVSLAAKKMKIRKVNADKASINLHYNNKLLTLNALSVNTCDGNLTGKATIYDLHKIDAEIKTENINVTKLFEQFENFGQKAIISENLKGNIFFNAKIKMDLDEKMEVIGKTMQGNVQLKLKDGHLIKYEPLQKISDFVFRNRDFNDITFTEINETFRLDGFKMTIEEMEIASNVLNLYVSGLYDFKGKSNINLLLPWSNLKKRGKNYIPKGSGQSAENSKGLKLNYSGYSGKLKLGLGNKENLPE